MDPVSCFLKENNYQIDKAYFEDSQFQIGYLLTLPELSLIYRFEKDTLIICDFKSSNNSNPGSATIIFINLLKNIYKKVNEIKVIKGLIIDKILDANLKKSRIKLRDLLIKQGAKIEHDKWGDDWLIYQK